MKAESSTLAGQIRVSSPITIDEVTHDRLIASGSFILRYIEPTSSKYIHRAIVSNGSVDLGIPGFPAIRLSYQANTSAVNSSPNSIDWPTKFSPAILISFLLWVILLCGPYVVAPEWANSVVPHTLPLTVLLVTSSFLLTILLHYFASGRTDPQR